MPFPQKGSVDENCEFEAEEEDDDEANEDVARASEMTEEEAELLERLEHWHVAVQ